MSHILANLLVEEGDSPSVYGEKSSRVRFSVVLTLPLTDGFDSFDVTKPHKNVTEYHTNLTLDVTFCDIDGV